MNKPNITTQIEAAIALWKAEHEGQSPDTLFLGLREACSLDKALGTIVLRYGELSISDSGKLSEIRVEKIYYYVQL